MIISDFDGVLNLDDRLLKENLPCEDYIVITGRCVDECQYVYDFFKKYNLLIPPIYFNPIRYTERGDHSYRSRLYSARHKVVVIQMIRVNICEITYFQEDDPLQYEFIRQSIPDLSLKLINSGGNY